MDRRLMTLGLQTLPQAAIKAWSKEGGVRMPVVDYSYLKQYGWKLIVKRNCDVRFPFIWAAMNSWSDVSLEIQTPLVTVASVVAMRLVSASSGDDVENLHVWFHLSTWTREGQVVLSEIYEVGVQSNEQLRFPPVEIATLRVEDILVESETALMQGDWMPALQMALRQAVSLHYFPLLPHQRKERITLEDEPGYHEGVESCRQGRYDEALRHFLEYAKVHPEEPGPLYNAAWMQVLEGKDEEALGLLTRARMLKDTPLYQDAWDRVRRRVGVAREVPAAPDVSTFDVSDEGAPRQCYTVERGPDGDARWKRGRLSTDTVARLLALEHPRECGQPQRPCFIERYRIQWEDRRWTDWFSAWGDDLSPKISGDGTVWRMWGFFSTHHHEYTYCHATETPESKRNVEALGPK